LVWRDCRWWNNFSCIIALPVVISSIAGYLAVAGGVISAGVVANHNQSMQHSNSTVIVYLQAAF
jgi:hypothetical protein